MVVIISTNDLVRLTFLVSLLEDGGFQPVLYDSNMAAVEGSIGAVMRRIAVPDTRQKLPWNTCARLVNYDVFWRADPAKEAIIGSQNERDNGPVVGMFMVRSGQLYQPPIAWSVHNKRLIVL